MPAMCVAVNSYPPAPGTESSFPRVAFVLDPRCHSDSDGKCRTSCPDYQLGQSGNVADTTPDTGRWLVIGPGPRDQHSLKNGKYVKFHV